MFNIGKRGTYWTLRRLQRLRLYRLLARKLVQKRLQYRVATLEDAPDLIQLYDENPNPSRDAIERLANEIKRMEGRAFFLLATLRERILGAVNLKKFSEEDAPYSGWWIFGLFVDSHYRGLGIGEGIMKMALQRASMLGAERVNLTTSQHNKVAINLYCKMGFRQTSIPEIDTLLEAEAQQGGSRRIIMFIQLV